MNTNLHRRALQAGRSLVEVMVSITIGLVVLVAISALYTSSTQVSRATDVEARMNETARIAFNLIGLHLRNAGYSSTEFINQTPLPGSPNWFKTIKPFDGAGVVGCDGPFTNPKAADHRSLVCSVTGATTAADAISIQYQSDASTSWAVSGSTVATDCIGNTINRVSTRTVAGNVLSYTLSESRFYLGPSPSSPSNPNVQSLYCQGVGAAPGAAAFSADPVLLLEHVYDLQFQYGVSLDHDIRNVQRYLEARQIGFDVPPAGVVTIPAIVASAAYGVAPTDDKWRRVQSVRMCIVVGSEDATVNADRRSYRDCDGALVTPSNINDKRLYRAFTQTFNLRNATVPL